MTTTQAPMHAPPSRFRPEATDATRYLCAAAHLDETFTRAVLDEVLYQEHRAVAPSHGISLIPIVRHAIAARRRVLVRDGVVAAALIVGLISSFTVGIVVVLNFLSILLLIRAYRALAARQTAVALGWFVIAVFVLPPLILLLAIGPALLEYGYQGLYYGAAEDGLSPARWPIWIGIVLLIWGTYIVYRITVHRTIAFDLTPDGFAPEQAPAGSTTHKRRLAYIEEAQRGNVTVYSQHTGARPFIGFGEVTQQWSLVTPLRPAASPGPYIFTPQRSGTTEAAPTEGENGPAVPFRIDELYEALRTSMAQLADPQLPVDEVVPHLSVRDKVFVAGRLPVSSPFIEHGQPRYRVAEPDLKALQHAERGRVRHYQSVRMAAWGGELEVTTFLHATVRGRMLYVEFVATVLPGIRERYHNIDTYDRLDAAAALRAVGRAIVDVLRSPLALVSVASAGGAAIRRSLNESSDYKRINRQLTFDYGCRTSVRELATDFDNPGRFQVYDAAERISLVERRLLQALVNFLDLHHYDVSDLAGQAATVINNGTQINNSNTFNNSTLNSSPVAAGTAASAKVRNPGNQPPSSPVAGRQ